MSVEGAISNGWFVPDGLFLTGLAFAAGWWALTLTLSKMRRQWAAAGVFVPGIAWLLYSPSILNWVGHLGSDSFSEAQNFDLSEARDLARSLEHILRLESLWATGFEIALGLLLALGVYTASAALSRKRGRTYARPVLISASLMVVAAVALQLSPAISAFQSNSDIYQNIYDNFHEHDYGRVIQGGPARDLTVVIYIGESTSTFNMGIYGYPRPTTPELAAFQSENEGFLVFHNVLSTHVHTAPSLLEALSIGIDASDDFFPIRTRQRVSVIDLLNEAGVSSTLISNQGNAGTWNNLASTVVFRNVPDREFSFNSAWLGELEHRQRRPLDHEFLVAGLDKRINSQRNGPQAVFLHSYAGHGPYLKNIDEKFKQPVDDFLRGRPAVSIVGSGLSDPDDVVRTIEAYDSAVRYIDHSIASVLQRIKAAQRPSVLVYFADHGDAVYAGRRHDSSRFVHEMARVPFLVYFNDLAAKLYPDTYASFRSASRDRRVSTLAQFPASLLMLFGLEAQRSFYKGMGLDELEALPPILTRETGAGFSFIRLGRAYLGEETHVPRDATDLYTALFRATRLPGHEGTRLCQHHSSTIGKALRGAATADCLWLDVVASDPGTGTADPARLIRADRHFGGITDIARSYGRSLWIAGRDLASVTNCSTLDSLLDAGNARGRQAGLVMFPSGTRWNKPEFRACIDSIRSNGFRTGLELPLGPAMQCSGDAAGEASDAASCVELAALVREIAASGAFTDLGLDFAAAEAIDRLDLETGLTWNAWNVPVGQLGSSQLSRFRNIAVDMVADPNER
jgi:glucan phosphoethanolaminetransferase (alkaline phosphatase superfamily)